MSAAKPPAGDCRVCAAIRACRAEFLAVGAFSCFENLLLLAVPLYMLQVYDRVLVSRSTGTLVYLTVIVVLALATLAVLHLARMRVLSSIALWLDRRLAPGLFERAIQSRLRAQEYGPEAFADLGTLRGFVASPAMMALFDLPWTLVFVAAAFLLHWSIGVLAIVAILALVGLTMVGEILTHKSVQAAAISGMIGRQQLESTVRNAEAIEAMGMMDAVGRRWLAQNDDAVGHNGAVAQRMSLVTSLTRWVRMIVQIAALGLAAYLVLLQQATPGTIIAASIILTRAIAPIEQTIGAWKSIVAVRESVRRLKTFAMERPYRSESLALPAPEGHLAVENIFYQPRPWVPPVLKGVTFALHAGQSLAIVGPSGAGKSSLARLLVGAIPPNAGVVRLDGADVFSWERTDFGRHVGYLPQDVELFAGTIAENIARMGDMAPEQIVDAARKARVHDLILSFPKGYETPIGPDGQYLSGGQRQRIALARAMVGNPRLVVLDEPNSNLDGDGEMALVEAVGALKAAGSTVVVITHRPALVQHVDTMLLLRGGVVEAFGPRQEVFARVVAQPPAPASPAGTRVAGVDMTENQDVPRTSL